MKTVVVDSLGICQHCGDVISIADCTFETDEDRAYPPCPLCKRHTFSWDTWGEDYDRDTKESERRFVGPDGQWTDQRPNADFIIGEYDVRVKGSVLDSM